MIECISMDMLPYVIGIPVGLVLLSAYLLMHGMWDNSIIHLIITIAGIIMLIAIVIFIIVAVLYMLYTSDSLCCQVMRVPVTIIFAGFGFCLLHSLLSRNK